MIICLSFTFSVVADEYSEGNEDYDNGAAGHDDDDDIKRNQDVTTINNGVDRVDADKKNENTHEEISGNDPDNYRKAEQPIECGTEHGCDHDCTVTDDRIKCACHDGFYLDESDGKTCHGKCDDKFVFHLHLNSR